MPRGGVGVRRGFSPPGKFGREKSQRAKVKFRVCSPWRLGILIKSQNSKPEINILHKHALDFSCFK
jgi:hypothetical protein